MLSVECLRTLGRLKILLLIIFVSVGCNDAELPAGVRANLPFGNTAVEKEQIIEIMRSRGIAFTTLNRGDNSYIVYNAEDMAEVLSIQRQVKFGDNLDSNYFESLILRDDTQRARFEEAFDEVGIRYFVSTDFDRIEIHWTQVDGPQVDEIRERLYIAEIRAL
ncbi:hypothetical protein [Lysobacter sp. N42]|uniref:hypothetical protein n=2 Tax=Gammaproteobacteria TaxID=1236 RepID=UPI000DD037CB|nr:hypothetical protein [Lysobacter sp. N42]TCZ90073.1 hypothetical protein EYQ95_09640 [Lysobacter sp. N42]